MKSRTTYLLTGLLFLLEPATGALGFSLASPLAGAHLTVLPNGLRLVHREHHSAPLVAIDVWVRAGSGKEGLEEGGAAHFLEHLLFKGTATRKPGEIDAAIEDLGATLSAGTTRDGAHVYTTVASEHAGAAMEVIADALQHVTLDAAEMERERAVILDELARAGNDGRKQVINALYADLHPGEALGRPILGSSESIRTQTRDRVVGFYRRWYVPNNVTVVIVGDISADAAESLAAANFGKWMKRELPAAEAAPALPAPVSAPPGRVSGPIWIACGMKTGSKVDAKSVAVGEVVARLVADGDFGQVPRALKTAAEVEKPPVNRRPSAAIVSPPPPALKRMVAECDARLGGGAFLLSALTDGGESAAAFKTVTEALTAMQKDSPTPEELDYAQRRAIGAHLFAVETYAGQARALAEYDVIGDFTIAVELAERMKKVTAADVVAFAKECFDPARMGRAVVPARGGK